MGDSCLWLANTNGNVFTISTRQQCLRQLVKTYRDGVKLKCIAAHCNGAWGIGHDHNVYVFVQSSDIPIRVQETTYENQRWAPLRGFHRSHLLPTDRGGWSDDVGDGDQPRECFQLPSEHWEWEGDWTIDNNFQGEVIPDPEGWMYATNFPGPWLLQSKWKSCVRRRKWIRFRRYTSTDVWALVSDTAVKDSGECFIQIAVGGFDMPKQPPGHLSVWAISITGDIYVRTNVTRDCPEGEDWQRLNTDTLGAVDISVGPTGQVWTVTWDGLAIVRLGINSEHVYGTDWVTVSYPDKDTRLMQLALGLNSLWVLSREGKVWFRKGISGGDLSSGNLSSVTGTVWIEMVGEMSYITITPNDHVFAIGMDDQEVYYRAGVTNGDLGGKSWQKLQLQEDIRGISTGSTSSCMSEMRNDSDLDESDCCCSDSVSVNSEVRSTPICDVVPVFSVVKSEMDGNEQPMQHGGIKTFSLPVLSAVSKECDFQVSPSEKNKGDISSVGTCGDITDGNFHVTLNNTGDINPGDAKVDSVMQTDDKIGNILKQSDDLFQDGEGVDNHCLSTPDVNESYEVKNESLTLPDNDKLKLTKDRSTSQSLVNDSDSNMWSPRSSEIFNFVTDLLNSEPNETNHDAPDSSDRMCPDKIQKITNSGKCSTSLTQGIQCSNNIPNNKMAATHRTPYSDAIPNDKKPNSGNPWTDVISNDKKTTSSSSHDNQAASIGWVSLLPSEAYTGTITDNCETSMSKNQSSCRPKSLQSNEGRDGTAAVPEETLMSDHSVVEMFVLTPAMPRYCWMQLSGLACTINNPTKVYWLQPRKESESGKDLKSKISVAIRQQILKLLQERNLKETENFQYYESAIDKSSWVKKASMQWFHFGRHAGWLPCTVELEVALKEGDTGLLTVHYKHRRKEMDVQILIQDIVCVYRVSTANQSTVFAVHTADTVKIIRPYLLSPSSEVEANDWVSVICGANASLWNLRSAIPVGSVWSTTLRGDTYIHRPPTCHVKANEMCWIPVGGHLEYIETSPCGVTWALGYNHTVWFYSGGYGGGVFKEQSGVSKDVHLQTDVRMMSVFENQRWYPLVGYFGCGLLRETYNDGARHREQNKEDVKLPSSLWQWDGDWCIDYNAQGGVDNEGWQYAVNFRQSAFHVRKGLTDRARRRRWVRKCKLETLGPWLQVGQTKLSDISIQVDQPSSPSDPLVVWAVGTRGNLLCRIGITREKPQGESWVHIPTDHLFHTVSVGGAYRVWAVAKDGSAWYRTGVSPNNPQGSNWLQVVFPPETGAALSRISAGGTAVWVVDRNGALWYRKDITATFPEGTSWVQICDKVLDVSVGLSNQVWIVANVNFSRNKYSRGVVYRRVGISEHSPAGTSWEIIIGSGWNHVSVRGQIEKYKSDML